MIDHCIYCRHWIPEDADFCSCCGRDQKRGVWRWLLRHSGALATIAMAVAMIITARLSFIANKNTLIIAERQVEESRKLYELQNRPLVSVRSIGWYPIKTLSGDVGLRIKMYVSNSGNYPTKEAKVIKDIFLRIKTDTLDRFPQFIEDMNKINEYLDVDKEKRIVEKYTSYRIKPFKDIAGYIIEKKGEVTGDEIMNHFSAEYKDEGYAFVKYNDLIRKGPLTIPPGNVIMETGRSVSVEGFENEILKDGGDILLFYWAVEYLGPLGIKKYVANCIGYYDSFAGVKQKDENGLYSFTYQKPFLDEFEIAK